MATEVLVDGPKGRTAKFQHRCRSRGPKVEVTMVQGVFGPTVGYLAVFVFHQHVRFRDGKGSL